jgi:hypothetical protein
MTLMTTRSVFLSKTGASALTALRDSASPSDLVRQASEAGGWRARWRVQGAINQESVALVAEAVRAHFAARRDELMFRTALLLDSAKKRAIAEQMADASTIEREILRMTQEAMRDIAAVRNDEARDAALDETRRSRELSAALERGEITQRRFEAEVRRIERTTDDIIEKVEALGERVLANLGERLDAALRTVSQART